MCTLAAPHGRARATKSIGIFQEFSIKGVRLYYTLNPHCNNGTSLRAVNKRGKVCV